jgi:hypothetical protein
MNKQKKNIDKLNKIIEEFREVKNFIVCEKSELYLRTMLKI